MLLPTYLLDEAKYFARVGDATLAAVRFLDAFQESPQIADWYDVVGELLPKAATKPSNPVERHFELEERWGPLYEFFASHRSPRSTDGLHRGFLSITKGMRYEDVARNIGFPPSKCSRHSEGDPPRICWLYHLNRSTILKAPGGMIILPGAEQGSTEIHIIIEKDRVVDKIIQQ